MPTTPTYSPTAIFDGKPPVSITNNATSEAGLPAWLQEYTKGLIGASDKVAGEDYQTYGGARLADLTAGQQAAATGVQNMQGSWKSGINDVLGSHAPTDPNAIGMHATGDISSYMNPYTDQVVNRIQEMGNRNFNENMVPGVNSTFSGAGQFGSTRNADFMNRAMRDSQGEILGAQGAALNTGYQQAMTNRFNDQTLNSNIYQNEMTNRQGDANRAATEYQNSVQNKLQATSDAQKYGYQDVSMMDTLGKQQQELNQKGLDLAYQEFQNQVNYPKEQLKFMNEQIRGLPNTSSTYSNTNPIAQSTGVSPLAAAAAGFTGTKALTSTTK